MATKEELSAQLDELKPALTRTLEAERGKVVAAGKPFDAIGWLIGQPIDQRYPTGPAYQVCIPPQEPPVWFSDAGQPF